MVGSRRIIDLYFIHHIDTQTPLEEMLRAFDDLVRQGKIRYAACGNYEAWRLMEALWISDSNGLARFEAYQPQHSLRSATLKRNWCRSVPSSASVWWCGRHSPAVICQANISLANIPLPARVRRRIGPFPPGSFIRATNPFLPNCWRLLASSAAAPQVAARWVLEQPQESSAIVGARTAQQFSETLDATAWRLSDEALRRLNEISALTHRYPRAMEDGMSVRRDQAGAAELPVFHGKLRSSAHDEWIGHLGRHADPYALLLQVFVDGLLAAFTTKAASLVAAEWGHETDGTVGVDPDGAGT